MSPSRFAWEETFLSELEIRQRYARGDHIPGRYTREFQATSSVLAWAGAHGKPVIATDHGVVGYRVKKHKLGVVYSSHNVRQLQTQLQQLPQTGSAEYRAWRQAGLDFAQASRLEVFKAKLGDHLAPGMNAGNNQCRNFS